MRKFLERTVMGLALAAVSMGAGGPASAQFGTLQEEARLRAATPSCDTHPAYRWIGRVAGNTDGAIDRSRPVSFVGCFPDEVSCERWKTRTSAIINTTLVQYSCRLR